MALWRSLDAMRAYARSAGAQVDTVGLSNRVLRKFERDPSLSAAVAQANVRHQALQTRFESVLKSDEKTAIQTLHSGFLNFYESAAVNPYVALAAQGPWVITAHGSVVYDSGGYGMLGYGHNPPVVSVAMSQNQVMANIMTASFEQAEFMQRIRAEVGHARPVAHPSVKAAAAKGDTCPYESFVCLNSGSEGNTLAMRIMDVDAKTMTDADGPHPGRATTRIALKGSFHGRTDRPAMVSDSSARAYQKHLASYSEEGHSLCTVEPNNIDQLRAAFEEADAKNLHVEGMFMEPVMGEGNPGVAITREFYDEARRLVDHYRSLLLVDSIQAGFRGTGALSLMDYPGFEDADPPDFETFSKSINAGQFPLSVLALGPRVPEIYVRGLYGNTMTTNPRALAVANAVMDDMTPELRSNIRDQGVAFKKQLEDVQWRNSDGLTNVTGTGLLVAAHFADDWKVFGDGDSVEALCRKRGLGVIHGGANALRFTPWYHITAPEVDLICEVVEDAVGEYRSRRAGGGAGGGAGAAEGDSSA